MDPFQTPVLVGRPLNKAEMRAACRKRWGKNWWKVHPVIKVARLAWASGCVHAAGDTVVVKEHGDVYVV